MPLLSSYQREKFAFTDDADAMALSCHLFGLAMFSAFAVARENTQILISDNQKGGFAGDVGLYGDSCAGCMLGCVLTGNRKGSSKTSDLAEKRTFFIAFSFYRRCIDLPSRCENFFKVHFCMPFGKENDLSGSASVLQCIVVIEFQVECLFEMGEAMPAVALEFRPRPLGDLDAVLPANLEYRDPVGFTGGIDCRSVEAAVLEDCALGQDRQKRLDDHVKARLADDMFRPDSVYVDVCTAKGGPRIDQRAKGGDRAIWAASRYADLADARWISIRSLYVQGEKSVAILRRNIIGRRGHLRAKDLLRLRWIFALCVGISSKKLPHPSQHFLIPFIARGKGYPGVYRPVFPNLQKDAA